MPGPFPADLLEPYGYGRGYRDILYGTTPAAGAAFSFKVPGEYRLRVISCVFTLTTTAIAANRYVTVEYRDGSSRAFAVSGAGVVVLASSTQRFAGSITRAAAEWASGTDIFFPLATDFLDPGTELAILVSGIDVGDTLTGIRFAVDKWPTGPSGPRVGELEERARGSRASLPSG